MQNSLGTIFVSETIYNSLNEIRIKARMKNFSAVVNTVAAHYFNLNDHNKALVERIKILTLENADLKESIKNFRDQIVDMPPRNPPIKRKTEDLNLKTIAELRRIKN